ncbi:MAG: hypothetical protein RRY76_05770, partial [Clostridia bacterium]
MEETVKIKRKRSKEEILEIIVAIFLGITALTTAWGSWIGSLHGGNQATNYTTSNNLAAEGNSMYNEAAQTLMQDMMLWNQISDVRIDYNFAKEKNETAEMEKAEWKLDQLMSDNCSEALTEAIQWADNQEEYASPFDKEGFVDSYFEAALNKLGESNALLQQGEKDNNSEDSFGLVTVIYSVMLFLLGIVGTFKQLPNRFIIM